MKRYLVLLVLLLCSAVVLFGQEPKDSDTVWVKEIGSDVKTVRFSPDGNYIYAAALGQKPLKLSTATGEILMEYAGFFYEATEHFSALDISSDGKWLIGGEYGNNMYIIDTETGVILKTLKTNYQDVQSNKFNTVTITPDKRYVIATNRFRSDPITLMNSIIVWDTESGELIKNIESKDFMKVKASPDNRYIAVSRYVTSPIEILIYNTEDWKLEGTLCCHTESIQDIAFSPDGSLLASCAHLGEIKIWDIANNKQPIILPDYGYISAINFIDNNTVVCNGYIDYTKSYTKIWNINEQKVLGMIETSQPYSIDIDRTSKNVVLANYKNILLFNAEYLIAGVEDNISETYRLVITPNPTSNYIDLNLTMNNAAPINIAIYDITSNNIALLYSGFLEIGNHNFHWDTKSVPSGNYFCKITSNTFSQTYKIMVQK